MMDFEIDKKIKKINGKLTYFKDCYAFDFEQPYKGGDITLEFGTLLLEFDSWSKCAVRLWGLNSYLGWIDKKLTVPQAVEGGLAIKHIEKYSQPAGVAIGVVDDGQWNTYFDKASGWICFGDPTTNGTDQAVEFADGVIAVLKDGAIKSFWLKPIFKQEVPQQ